MRDRNFRSEFIFNFKFQMTALRPESRSYEEQTQGLTSILIFQI